MKSDAPFAIMAVAGIALGLISATEIVAWLGSPGLFPSTAVQDGVLALMIMRLALFLIVPSLRRMGAGSLVILFSGDIIVLPVVAAFFLQTGDPLYGEFGREFLASWLSAGLLFYPALAAFLVVRAVGQNSRLSYVLPAAAGSFGISSLALDALSSGSGVGGLQGVVGLALAGLRKPTAPYLGTTMLLYGCGALLFASLAAYSVTGAAHEWVGLVPRLALCFAGVVALVAWVLVVPPIGTWVTLGLPAAVIVGTVWVMTREG